MKCRLCDRDDLRFVVSGPRFRVWRCATCGTGNAEVYAPHRSDDYAAAYERDLVQHKAAMCWTLLRDARHGELRGLRLLDIGCGRGEFLDLAKAAGMITTGVEPALDAAGVAMHAHDVLVAGVEEPAIARFEDTFDVVTMWDVLEHLDHPREALTIVLRSLRRGGLLIGATPLMGSVFDRVGIEMYRATRGRLPQLLEMCWSDEHLTRSTPSGLLMQLEELGFTDVVADRGLLLSLRSDRYAGGEVMESWTRHEHINRAISLIGVTVVRALRSNNKVIFRACRSATAV